MKTSCIAPFVPLLSLAGALLFIGCARESGPAPAPSPSLPPVPASAWKPYRVTDFGAKGNGTADDTDAIQRCILAAEKKQIPFYKSDTGFQEVVFPAGTYRITRPLVVALANNQCNLAFRGEGAVTLAQEDPHADIFYIHYGYRQTFENLSFTGGRRQIKFFSRNKNRAQLLVRNCRFSGASSYAVDDSLFGAHHSKIVEPFTVAWSNELPFVTETDAESQPDVYFTSSVLHLDRCVFDRCRNVARIFADWGILSRCQIVTDPEMTGAAIYSRGVLKVSDTRCKALTRPGRQQRFADNVNGGVMLHRVEIETDGPGLCAIYNRRIYDNGGQYNSYAVVDDCRIHAAGSEENCMVFCEEVPNVVRVTQTEETSGTTLPAIGFRQPVQDAYLRLVSFPEIAKRLPELRRIFGYEASMPRIYDIPDWKLPNTFAFSLYGNRGLNEDLPPRLESFRQPIPPARIRASFADPENAGPQPPPESDRTLNVFDFGAKGDGETDDTAAIEAAFAAAKELHCEELIFPGGLYRISRTIALPDRMTIRGRGLACFQAASNTLTLFSGSGIRRLVFSGAGFTGAAVAADLKTDASEPAEILFDRCTFAALSEAGVRCLSGRGDTGEKNRTSVRVSDCVFGMRGHVLYTNADDARFEFNWHSLYDTPIPGSLVNLGTMRVLDIIGVPDNQNVASWIENAGTLIVDNMRFGGEGLLKKDLIVNTDPRGEIYMRYSWLCCHKGSVLICRAAPRFAALLDNFGPPDEKTQTFLTLGPGVTADPATFLFDSGNIPPLNVRRLSEQP